MLVRTGAELKKVIASNPFPKAPPNWTVAIFLDEPPPRNTLGTISGSAGEEVALGKREIYVHYGSGMARSKLKDSSGRCRELLEHEHDRQTRGVAPERA